MVRDGIGRRAHAQNQERDLLLGQLELINEALRPIEGEINNCKEEANIMSTRTGYYFAGAILAQFAFSQYGTYVAFSWDIMEPITCAFTLFDAIAAYWFWCWSGKPWDVNGLREHFFDRRLKKLLKKK